MHLRRLANLSFAGAGGGGGLVDQFIKMGILACSPLTTKHLPQRGEHILLISSSFLEQHDILGVGLVVGSCI